MIQPSFRKHVFVFLEPVLYFSRLVFLQSFHLSFSLELMLQHHLNIGGTVSIVRRCPRHSPSGFVDHLLSFLEKPSTLGYTSIYPGQVLLHPLEFTAPVGNFKLYPATHATSNHLHPYIICSAQVSNIQVLRLQKCLQHSVSRGAMHFPILVLALAGVSFVSAVPAPDSVLPCAICPPTATSSDELLPLILISAAEGTIDLTLQCTYVGVPNLSELTCTYLNLDGALLDSGSDITCGETATVLTQPGIGPCIALPV
ncbi:hypothetical protein F5050DRAFT_1721184 [Lentinula boryana]|uniref:Uncharacterized protein n=1 Tax=Lentinula boryana TaxID=40481 RepID=A0ABQ8QTA7_9AGAR|nr:hypothetical protein F5050DRAFT_1721184 [Lentinula boryana]